MKRLIIAGLMLCICLSVVGCGTATPDVLGMTLDDATGALESAGLTLGQVSYDERSTEPTGSVIAQTPEAGKRGKDGSQVDITLAGPPPVEVPNLLGKDEAAAASALDDAGLILGDTAEAFDPEAPTGIVIEQAPAQGTMLDQGLSVAIVISKGPEPVAIPTVTGKTEAEAKELLEAAGFEVTVATKDDKASKGTVIAVSPTTATALPGTKVTITVSTGVEMVKVPNVLGMYSDDAAAKLRSVGLKVKDVSIHGPLDSDAFSQDIGEVYRQTPKAGSTVPRGTTVEIRSWWEAS